MNAAFDENGRIIRFMRQFDAFEWKTLVAFANIENGDNVLVLNGQIVEPCVNGFQMEIVIPVHVPSSRIYRFDCAFLRINLRLEIGCLKIERN